MHTAILLSSGIVRSVRDFRRCALVLLPMWTLIGCSNAPRLDPRIEYAMARDLVARSDAIFVGRIESISEAGRTVMLGRDPEVPLVLHRIEMTVEEVIVGVSPSRRSVFYSFLLPERYLPFGPAHSRSVFAAKTTKVVFLRRDQNVLRTVVDVIQSESTVCADPDNDRPKPEVSQVGLRIASLLLTPGSRCTESMFAGSLREAVPFASDLANEAVITSALSRLTSHLDDPVAIGACIALATEVPRRHPCLKELLRRLPPEDPRRREAKYHWEILGDR